MHQRAAEAAAGRREGRGTHVCSSSIRTRRRRSGGSGFLNGDWSNHFSAYRCCRATARCAPRCAMAHLGTYLSAYRVFYTNVVSPSNFGLYTDRLRRIAPSRGKDLSTGILAIMCCHVSRRRRPSTPRIQTAAHFNTQPSVLKHIFFLDT